MASLIDRFKNEEVEKSFIASLLIDVLQLNNVRINLNPEDFYNQTASEIFRAIIKYIEKYPGEQIDYGLLSSITNGKIPVHVILEYYSHESNLAVINDYAREIKANSMRRELARRLSIGATKLANGEEISDVIDTITEIENLQKSDERFAHNLQEAMANAYISIYSDVISNGQNSVWFDFPWLKTKKINLKKGQVCVIAARPGDGKSAFAIWQSYRWAKSGKSVLYISLEMSSDEIALRIASNVLHIPMDNFDNEDNALKLSELTAVVPETFLIIDAINNLEGIEKVIKTILPDIVIIDYLGLINAGGHDDIYQRVSKVSRRLKQIAMTHKVIMVVIQQVNRHVNSRATHELFLHDLRDSGQVEQDADKIIFIYPQGDEELPREQKRKMFLKLAKNRQGDLALLEILFNMPMMDFGEIDTSDRPNARMP